MHGRTDQARARHRNAYRHVSVPVLATLMIMTATALAPAGAQTVAAQDVAATTARPIRLVAGDIDPIAVETLTRDDASQPGRYIVQFDRPVSQLDRAALEAGGALVTGYLPDYSFAVRVLAGTSIPDVEGISTIVEFEPSWRMSPASTIPARWYGFASIRTPTRPKWRLLQPPTAWKSCGSVVTWSSLPPQTEFL